MIDDLNDMLIFAEVVRSGSITRAGERLDLPKATVSRRLSRLEARLGTKLLHKTTRRLELTEVGEAYYERCLPILEEVEETRDFASQLSSKPRGRLRITAPADFAAQWLAVPLATFCAAYPEITVDIDLSSRQVDLIAERVDVAIRAGQLSDSTLVARPLLMLTRSLYASPLYLSATGLPATPDELTQILPLAAERPIHIHIAEQVKEVEDCIAWSGKRPVEWLLENQPVDSRWCLIHATHMLPQETLGMAKAGAIAGLCPITEANLGDGIFPGVEFLSAGGRYGVGSDQNVLIGVSDELRQLEYSLRLATRSRNVAAQPNQSTGRALFDGALAGGAVALGAKSGIAVGLAADFVSLNRARAPYLKDDAVLDGWIFAGNVIPDCVWVHGVKQVEGGRHVRRERIEQRFLAAMKQLTDTL